MTNIVARLRVAPAATGADLKRCGLATHYVKSSDLARIETILRDLGLRSHAQGAVDQALSPFEVRRDQRRRTKLWACGYSLSVAAASTSHSAASSYYLAMQAAADGGRGILDQLAEINACFRGDTVEAIMDALSSHDSDLARGALQSMSR